MEYSIRPDWMTVSGKTAPDNLHPGPFGLPHAMQVARWVLTDLLGSRPDLQIENPRRFYEYSFTELYSGIRFACSSNMAHQGWLLEIPGKTWLKAPYPTDWVAWANDGDHKVTRFDLAVDIFYSGITPVEVADEQRAAVGEGGRTQLGYISSKTGDTTYIGSRKSAKLLRVYDKAAEQGVVLDWIRCEAEFKKEAAAVAASEYVSNRECVVATMRDMLEDTSSKLYTVLLDISKGAARFTYFQQKERSKRGVWLRSQVLKAIADYAADNIEDLQEFLVEVYDIVEDQKALNAERKLPPNLNEIPF